MCFINRLQPGTRLGRDKHYEIPTVFGLMAQIPRAMHQTITSVYYPDVSLSNMFLLMFSTRWTYNQGPILSALGAMANLTGDNSYIDFALTTLDGVVDSPGTPSLPQTENGNNFLEIVNGNLAEWCDGASSSTCNNDQQYFKVVTLFCINPACYF